MAQIDLNMDDRIDIVLALQERKRRMDQYRGGQFDDDGWYLKQSDAIVKLIGRLDALRGLD